MTLQVAAVVGLILGRVYQGWIQTTAKALLWAVVLLALISMVQYFREFWSKLDSSIKHRESRRLRLLERNRQIRAERRELRRLRKLERQRETQLEGETSAVSSLRDSR
jgi:hypothetical protein